MVNARAAEAEQQHHSTTPCCVLWHMTAHRHTPLHTTTQHNAPAHTVMDQYTPLDATRHYHTPPHTIAQECIHSKIHHHTPPHTPLYTTTHYCTLSYITLSHTILNHHTSPYTTHTPPYIKHHHTPNIIMHHCTPLHTTTHKCRHKYENLHWDLGSPCHRSEARLQQSTPNGCRYMKVEYRKTRSLS